MFAVGKVDIGKRRKCNEDAFFISREPIGALPNLFIVADGMGGHGNGALASKLAIEAFVAYIEAHKHVDTHTDEGMINVLKRGISHANHIVYKKGEENTNYKGMGTTLTVCTLRESTVYVVHVGDSRVYIIGEENTFQVTKDHSVVQEMMEQGYISKNDMRSHPQRHMITRAVGTYESVQVDGFICTLEDDEYLLMCSDGLTTMVADQVLCEMVLRKDLSLEGKVQLLINEANKNGGQDNIALIIGKQCEVNEKC